MQVNLSGSNCYKVLYGYNPPPIKLKFKLLIRSLANLKHVKIATMTSHAEFQVGIILLGHFLY